VAEGIDVRHDAQALADEAEQFRREVQQPGHGHRGSAHANDPRDWRGLDPPS
jgi:hypothetical protein